MATPQRIIENPVVSGVWAALTHQPPAGVTNCLLRTDATVFCHGTGTRNWYRLTADNTGSYANGTWTTMASMQVDYAPLYFASAVLPDGRVIVEGGEYDCTSGCGSPIWQNKGSIYDPVTNTWTAMSPPAGWTRIGDAMATVLADGRFMLSDATSVKTAVLNAITLTWTAFGTGKINGFNNEEGWTLLPDQSLLTVDVTPRGSTLSERFIPSTAMWVSAGSTGVSLADNANDGISHSFEIGPGALRPDGTVFYIGANPNITSPCCMGFAHTGVFNSGTGLWTAGPDVPNHDAANDAPAAVLPTGNVLFQAAPPLSSSNVFGTPSRFYEFDGSAITQVASPGSCGGSCGFPAFVGGMLVLPTGQVLYTSQGVLGVQIYTPAGSAPVSSAPAIGSVPATLRLGQHYFISGTQFNGLTQGAYYGDDLQAATNYPIVQITNTGTGHKSFASTHGHSSMGVATGSTIVSTTFDVSLRTELGASTLVVIANGIASAPVAVTVLDVGGTRPGDFDADGRGDRTVFRPGSGVWYSALTGNGSTATTWGVSDDIDVPGDYDGDGKADVAVFRPSTGEWFIVQSSNSVVRVVVWGISGDIPLAGDVDGDGKDDLVIFRPSIGGWYFNKSGGGTGFLGWGTSTDQPLLVDFDGDGKADPTVFRPNNGFWYSVLSTGGTKVTGWGTTGDIPVAGDFDGDGKSDVTVFRPSTSQWFVLNSSNGSATVVTWGASGDIPVSGDWDGDGRSDFTVWRPGSAATWYTQYANGGIAVVGWGTTGDRPSGRRPGS